MRLPDRFATQRASSVTSGWMVLSRAAALESLAELVIFQDEKKVIG